MMHSFVTQIILLSFRSRQVNCLPLPLLLWKQKLPKLKTGDLKRKQSDTFDKGDFVFSINDAGEDTIKDLSQCSDEWFEAQPTVILQESISVGGDHFESGDTVKILGFSRMSSDCFRCLMNNNKVCTIHYKAFVIADELFTPVVSVRSTLSLSAGKTFMSFHTLMLQVNV